MVFGDFFEFESFEAGDADLALGVKSLRQSVLLRVPKHVDEFVGKYHVKLVADLDV